MFLRMALLTTLPVCLLAGFWDRNDGEKYEFLTESEMRSLIGGHGGAACDTCTGPNERLDECAHFTLNDTCKTNQCIENWLIEDTCEVAVQSDCWAEIDFDLDSLFQNLRADSNCTTNNPSNWEIWRINYYGSDCQTRTYKVRCQKPSNNCNGTLISGPTYRSPAIKCI